MTEDFVFRAALQWVGMQTMAAFLPSHSRSCIYLVADFQCYITQLAIQSIHSTLRHSRMTRLSLR